MDSHQQLPISLTPTIARQTPRNEFGQVLQDTLANAGRTVQSVGGTLLGNIPAPGIVSAAVRNVASLASTQVVPQLSSVVPGAHAIEAGISGQVLSSQAHVSTGLNDMVQQMRAEADRSMVMQMEVQQESREYNALSNVIKVRHDSAKAAISNIR